VNRGAIVVVAAKGTYTGKPRPPNAQGCGSLWAWLLKLPPPEWQPLSEIRIFWALSRSIAARSCSFFSSAAPGILCWVLSPFFLLSGKLNVFLR